ncbi:peptidase M42 [Brevibacillus reuszeri]|uniref:Peptidase M42 n=1 Tax=Brevibacillus reuszeri TaxID=54915 RepID=A0ABQ0TFU6_9BACL|nr:M42 family metallopeptidase [Brevibacillus reuszeri]MED1857408.1 M42 family metallopeptidase [Brevibacillus reuszeri]GED66762.1 peptidase M42 [Brevibacillus reuszeri]
MKRLEKWLTELDAIPAVAGDEERVAAYLREQLHDEVDEYQSDALGNQIFIRKGSDPNLKVMLCAHMDEIGFIVNYVDERGFIMFLPVGGHDSRMVINQVLEIHTEKGVVKGVTGAKPSHIVTAEEAKLAIPLSELYLDVGTSSRAETEGLGVMIGDFITFSREGQFLNGGKVFTGKAVDNRSGCAVMLEVMKRLAGKALTASVYAVGSVQEEVGMRGAGPAAFSIQPDVALAIDVALTGGTPKIEEKTIPLTLGGGPVILFYEWVTDNWAGSSVPKKLTRKLVQTAEKNQIPYQRGVYLNCVTDTYSISLAGKGTIAGCISVPSRYIHSATGLVHMDDLENAVQLIVAFIESFDQNW